MPDLPGVLSADDIRATVASIAAEQEATGAIPWHEKAQLDPWDHVEAAMALDVGGETERAEAAYDWLRRTQRADGSWASRYENGVVADATAETNHAAYLAVGCWHHFLCTGDEDFLARLWPAVRAALDFVTGCQAAGGEIWWAAGDEVALLTGSSSIHQALRCGIAIADRVGEPQPDWELAADLLGHAIRRHPEVFADKSRYSMDWYYPVLGGALRGEGATTRLRERWDEFVVPGRGARCVSDQPWVTGAETCELALALDAIGDRDAATGLVAAMQHLREPDGSYWTGLVLTDGVRWPVERTTWTAAAVVLAVDALHAAHPRSEIFRTPGVGAAAAANRGR
ncbi:prenyltransferase/squalene oxidase repeat-containing protein [Actinoplanes italicus]|uniref:prenyltransferase/squalene oxidase repeat-containing protein n=1 Tax=Actinoplanes italicus TaxID=113567 RepID=UPI001EF3B089|nr:prenyltransferase/squalene oxidase repeat-containing protein [Actinoplanes italicus]